MTVIRLTPTMWTSPRSRRQMVAQILEELRGGSTQRPRPVSFEIPIDEGNSYHVIVVWSLWDGIRPDTRANMVAEAYEKLDADNPGADPMAPKVTIAIGATPPEALDELKLLPFRIGGPTAMVQGHRMDGMEEEIPAIIDSIELVGGFACGGKYYLAYPTSEMADDALETLKVRHRERGWQRIDLV